MEDSPDRCGRGISRRDFLRAGAVAGAGLAVAGNATSAWAADGPSSPGPLRIGGVRVDAMQAPLGIQSSQPRLSWTLTGKGMNRRQAAYEIRVATSTERLNSGRADLWSSGRVT